MPDDKNSDDGYPINDVRSGYRFLAHVLGFLFGLFWYIRWNKQYDFYPLNQWFDFIR